MLIPKTGHWIEFSVETGVKHGINKAYKHTDDPTREELQAAITASIMYCLEEGFTFPKEDEL